MEKTVYEHQEDEPQVYHAYSNDDDFSDMLFGFVYRGAWEEKQAQQAEHKKTTVKQTGLTEQPVTKYKPEDRYAQIKAISDIFGLDEDLLDELLELKLSEANINEFGRFNRLIDTVDFEKAKSYFEKKEGTELSTFKINVKIYDFIQDFVLKGGFDINVELGQAGESAVSAAANDGELSEPEPPSSPAPVFFVDWDTAQSDFDLNLYKDGDIFGYNKDGVEYKLGRMGDFVYTTTTTGITPWGDITGSTNIPRNIWEQMSAYRSGNLTEGQVRQNYLAVIDAFKNQKISQTTETVTQEANEVQEPIIEEPKHDTEAESIDVSGIWYRVGDTVYFNNAEHEITNIAGNGVVTNRDTKGGLRHDSPEMFDALMFTDNRNLELRSRRIGIAAKMVRTPQVGDQVYHNGTLYRLDGIAEVLINLYNLKERFATDFIMPKERFFEELKAEKRNRHLLDLF